MDHLNEYNEHHGKRLSSKNIQEAVLVVMEEEEEVLIPTYCRVPRVGNTDNLQTAAAGQTGRTLKP